MPQLHTPNSTAADTHALRVWEDTLAHLGIPTETTAASSRAEPGWQHDQCQGFQALANLLSSLGMARESAVARSWALLPPPQRQWQEQLKRWDQTIRNPLALQHLNSRSDQATALHHVEHLVGEGQLNEALALLETLAQDNQLPPHLCNKLGYLHEQRGDHWQAERWYRTSLHRNPSQVQTWCTLASCLLAQQVADEALECAQHALALHPEHPWGLKLQQRALLLLGAQEQLRALKEQNLLPLEQPPDPPAWLHQQHLGAPNDCPPDLTALLALRSCLQDHNRSTWAIGRDAVHQLLWLGKHGLGECHPIDLSIFGYVPSASEGTQLEAAGFSCSSPQPLYRASQLEQPPALVVISLQQQPGCPIQLQPTFRNPATALLCHHEDLAPQALAPRQAIQLAPHWTLWTT